MTNTGDHFSSTRLFACLPVCFVLYSLCSCLLVALRDTSFAFWRYEQIQFLRNFRELRSPSRVQRNSSNHASSSCTSSKDGGKGAHVEDSGRQGAYNISHLSHAN